VGRINVKVQREYVNRDFNRILDFQRGVGKRKKQSKTTQGKGKMRKKKSGKEGGQSSKCSPEWVERGRRGL